MISVVSTRLIMLQLLCWKLIINIEFVYAPQPPLFADEKYCFYNICFRLVTSVTQSETIIITGDLNGYVGQHSQGFNCHHDGCGY